MMIKLSEIQIANLINQPESGMGYQTVLAEYATPARVETRKATVYNSELLLWEDEPRSRLVKEYGQLIREASSLDATRVRSITVVPRSTLVRESDFVRFVKALGKPATEGTAKKTEQGDVFARFTAYINDRRITPKKGLTPGTYATTWADATMVKTGSEAVERYALPDPKPAVFRFKIDPHKGTFYREGIVQPAYGHKGGGVEVIFDNGTQDNTVSGPMILLP